MSESAVGHIQSASVRANRLRSLAVICGLVLLISVFDVLSSGLRESRTGFYLVAGSETPVSGRLFIPSGEDARAEHSRIHRGKDEEILNKYLAYTADSNDVGIRFKDLSGSIWRGTLMVPAYASPGRYQFRVYVTGHPPAAEDTVYHVRIYENEQALRRDLGSYIQRHLGIQPWWVTIIFLPATIAACYAVYRETGREETHLRRHGIGVIYKLKLLRKENSWEVEFGLGLDDGVKTGDVLNILNSAGRQTGTLKAQEVSKDSAMSLVDRQTKIKPGYYVASSKPQPAGGDEDGRP